MSAHTIRRMQAQDQMRQNMKARHTAWWHVVHSPMPRVTIIPLNAVPEGLAAALGRMAGDTDETPPKAH